MKHYLALLSILLVAISARAGESKIEGVVLGANDQPLRNTTVEFVNETTPQQPTTVQTNQNGLFLAPVLAPGSYTVAVFVNPETRWRWHQIMVANGKTTHLAFTSKSFAHAPKRVVWVDPNSRSIERVYTMGSKEFDDFIKQHLGMPVP
jgi:hypothetical protein